MKFILGLLVGGGLMFGWFYMNSCPKSVLNQEREKSKTALVEALAGAEKANAENLVAAKTKIASDYDAQLKAAESRVGELNADAAKVRAELVTVKATLANVVENSKVEKVAEVKPVATVNPIEKKVTVQPKAVQQETPQSTILKKSTPAPSVIQGARPVEPVKKAGKYLKKRTSKKMDGSVTTNFYYSEHP